MATYTYTSSFSVGGVGINGATVNAYRASRFSSEPALNASAPGSADATTTTAAAAGFNGAFQIALPTFENYYISVTYLSNTYWVGPVSQMFADGTAQGGTAAAGTMGVTQDILVVGGAATLQTTTNTASVVQTQAWQNQPRRGGNIGAATSGDASSAFPYGQLEVCVGDSIAAGTGTSAGGFGTRDWASILANTENRLLGLPDAGIGIPGSAGRRQRLGGLPQFSAVGANLTLVPGLTPAIVAGLNSGIQLTGSTFASSTAAGAANSLTDNRVFNRVLIFYQPVLNADGIGVSVQGQNGATFATIDATITALTAGTAVQTPHGNSTVAFWDSGVIASPTVAPVLSLFRSSTHPSGAGGGSAVTIYGALYYAPGVAGTSGLSMLNIGSVASSTGDWVAGRIWESLLSASRHQRCAASTSAWAVNDIIDLARTSTDAAFNNSTTLTSASAAFQNGDAGRPVTGNANIPANTLIASVTNTTTVILTNATTGGSLTAQSVTFGQIPAATTTTNLTTIVTRLRAAANPTAETCIFGEYQPSSVGQTEHRRLLRLQGS